MNNEASADWGTEEAHVNVGRNFSDDAEYPGLIYPTSIEDPLSEDT